MGRAIPLEMADSESEKRSHAKDLSSPLRYPPMAHTIKGVEFIETPTFTRLLADLLTDDEYASLQNVLVQNPERGGVIKGGGGIRKLRFALPGRGKSGGVRVIYYWGSSVKTVGECWLR